MTSINSEAPVWPEPHRSPLNALTVDVEDYFHVAALSDVISSNEWPVMPTRVDGNTRRLIDLFDEARVRATFFVLGWVAQRFPTLVRTIHDHGHEVACHGFSHSLVYQQTPQQFRKETGYAKRLLEDLTGAPVSGYRAASYSITKKSWWALDVIAEEGFKYDSSVFPIRHDVYGVPNSPVRPHELLTSSGARLVEFPPTTFQFLGLNVPVGGGGYFRLYPYWLTRYFLRRVNNAGVGPFIFYVHPWEIDPSQPRVRARLLSRLRHYVNLDRTESRLRRLLTDFRFGTARNVLELAGLLT